MMSGATPAPMINTHPAPTTSTHDDVAAVLSALRLNQHEDYLPSYDAQSPQIDPGVVDVVEDCPPANFEVDDKSDDEKSDIDGGRSGKKRIFGPSKAKHCRMALEMTADLGPFVAVGLVGAGIYFGGKYTYKGTRRVHNVAKKRIAKKPKSKKRAKKHHKLGRENSDSETPDDFPMGEL